MNRKALVVGINRYPNFNGKGKGQHLPKAPGDAEAIAKMLRDYGRFEVQLLPETYTDGAVTVEEKGIVKVQTLKDEIYNLFVKSPDGTQTVLLFFAGHGLVKNEYDEEYGYLCGSDTNCQDQKILGVEFDWLAKQLAKSKVPEQIIWLDCCHSGKLNQEILQTANSGIKRSIITSCRPWEESLAVDGHGVLTHLLLKSLDPHQYSVGFDITSSEVQAGVEREFHAHPQFKTYPQRPIFFHCGRPIHFWEGREKNLPKPTDNEKTEPVNPVQNVTYNIRGGDTYQQKGEHIYNQQGANFHGEVQFGDRIYHQPPEKPKPSFDKLIAGIAKKYGYLENLPPYEADEVWKMLNSPSANQDFKPFDLKIFHLLVSYCCYTCNRRLTPATEYRNFGAEDYYQKANELCREGNLRSNENKISSIIKNSKIASIIRAME